MASDFRLCWSLALLRVQQQMDDDDAALVRPGGFPLLELMYPLDSMGTYERSCGLIQEKTDHTLAFSFIVRALSRGLTLNISTGKKTDTMFRPSLCPNY